MAEVDGAEDGAAGVRRHREPYGASTAADLLAAVERGSDPLDRQALGPGNVGMVWHAREVSIPAGPQPAR